MHAAAIREADIRHIGPISDSIYIEYFVVLQELKLMAFRYYSAVVSDFASALELLESCWLLAL